MRKAIATVFWMVGLFLIFLLVTSNENEVIKIDLSRLKTDQLIVGTNDYPNPNFKTTITDFFIPEYQLVMIGYSSSKIVYQGLNQNGWYEAEENIFLNIAQCIKKVYLENKNLMIVCGKSVVYTTILIVIITLVFGLMGSVVLREN